MTQHIEWPSRLEIIKLSAGDSRLELTPQIGGSIARYYNEQDGQIFDWLRPASAEALAARRPTGMASYPLIPFCNRIRNGRFSFGGRNIVLPLNVDEPHALHGFAWQRTWQCVQHSDTHARMIFVHESDAWPWPFEAEQIYQLNASSLTVLISVTNTGNEPMPIGIGHHPYLLHRPGTRLQTKVDAMWEGDHEVMPTIISQPSFINDLARGTLLAPIVRDNNFIGWQHSARVEWPAQQAELTLSAKPPLNFFVLYSPDHKDHFCIEGVSNCTDWLNLRELPHADIGGHVIAPEETFSGVFSLSHNYL